MKSNNVCSVAVNERLKCSKHSNKTNYTKLKREQVIVADDIVYNPNFLAGFLFLFLHFWFGPPRITIASYAHIFVDCAKVVFYICIY